MRFSFTTVTAALLALVAGASAIALPDEAAAQKAQCAIRGELDRRDLHLIQPMHRNTLILYKLDKVSWPSGLHLWPILVATCESRLTKTARGTDSRLRTSLRAPYLHSSRPALLGMKAGYDFIQAEDLFPHVPFSVPSETPSVHQPLDATKAV
ncbi:hypothetical protein LshimejAT787_0700150 [Lyophyllum shimeji]|uniref:Uncharacterized protein n=1 Tax=Lyophyllum shimeji TaxID=47721 RepID=A0A9P3UPW7_LYOSH|nr:hypothetical protein LshimejAT787_0700150 [Lyophyllum shimeji]